MITLILGGQLYDIENGELHLIAYLPRGTVHELPVNKCDYIIVDQPHQAKASYPENHTRN